MMVKLWHRPGKLHTSLQNFMLHKSSILEACLNDSCCWWIRRSAVCAGVLTSKLFWHSRFCIGDYMDISITPPNRMMPMMRRGGRPYWIAGKMCGFDGVFIECLVKHRDNCTFSEKKLWLKDLTVKYVNLFSEYLLNNDVKTVSAVWPMKMEIFQNKCTFSTTVWIWTDVILYRKLIRNWCRNVAAFS
jgi:hypothetical protein